MFYTIRKIYTIKCIWISKTCLSKKYIIILLPICYLYILEAHRRLSPKSIIIIIRHFLHGFLQPANRLIRNLSFEQEIAMIHHSSEKKARDLPWCILNYTLLFLWLGNRITATKYLRSINELIKLNILRFLASRFIRSLNLGKLEFQIDTFSKILPR